MSPGAWDYVRKAFNARPIGMFVPPNWIGLGVFALLGLINPGFWVLGLGLELGYLWVLSSHPRFQRLAAASMRLEANRQWQAKMEAAVRQLGAEDQQKYRFLEARCRSLLEQQQQIGAAALWGGLRGLACSSQQGRQQILCAALLRLGGGRLIRAQQSLDQHHGIVGSDLRLSLELIGGFGKTLRIQLRRSALLLTEDFAGVRKLGGRSGSFFLLQGLGDGLEGLHHVVPMIVVVGVGLIQVLAVAGQRVGNDLE